MATSLAQKLRLKENDTLLTIHAPKEFKTLLGELPAGITISANAGSCNQVHWFVKSKAQVEKEEKTVLSLLKEEVICWIYFPKGSSKMQTDLTRDKGWEVLQKYNLQWISLISFDDTWSTFGVRLQANDKKKAAVSQEREVLKYIDPVQKLIFLPEDLAGALKGATQEETFFNTLSFTNRKEYLEWVVSAKRAETRATRVKETIARLGKGWKNPANR